MELDTSITIQPPPNTNPRTNKIEYPPPLVLEKLYVNYIDNPTDRTVFAAVGHIPGRILLLQGDEYDKAGDYTKSFIHDKLKAELGDDPAAKLRSMFPRTLEEDPDGPGSILSGMISTMGIKSTPNCSCRRHAIQMNTEGPDWCDNNMDTILSWLEEESSKRKLPFVRTVAKMMVSRAISKSRRLLAKKAKTNE